MKVEKFKVLLYLKKSEPDKTGKAPIMGRITLNRTMAQFSCKLSCTPELWNARESRLNGKSRNQSTAADHQLNNALEHVQQRREHRTCKARHEVARKFLCGRTENLP